MTPSNNLNSFRHILKSSSSTYESSGSQFCRTTPGIESEPGAFDESRFHYLFNQLGSYRNIIWFQISSRRINT